MPPLHPESRLERKLDLSLLDEDQLQAATAPRGPVCILAGAGTGKTRTITYRIAHLVDQGLVVPQRVLAVSFTRRAAGEMRERLVGLGVRGVQTSTFHAATLRQLRYFWPQVVGDLPWRILDKPFSVAGRAVRDVGLDTGKEMVRDVLGEIDWAKASLVTPQAYPEAVAKIGRTPPADAAQVARAYERYEQLKAHPEGMLLDYSDLLIHVAGALENSAAVAEIFRNQYRTFVVDEYQDVTPLQQRVLNAWLGDRDDLTVVGDANQTIYSFAGATPDYLLNFSRDFPHAVVRKLQRDYRSTPQVTDLANEVIGQANGRMAGTRLQLQGMRDPGPAPEFRAFESEEIEAREVAGQILSLINQGVEPKEIAILYRINAQSIAFEEALADAGVVYQVRGGEGFFERQEIQAAVRQLITASRRTDLPDDPVQVTKAALVPLGLSAEEPTGAQARERWQMLSSFVELVEQIVDHNPGIDLTGVLSQLARRRDDRQPPAANAVTLSTIHAAKGLEWDAVFLVGLSEGLMPIKNAIQTGEEAVEEERRVFYVGITRAREHLMCSWALAKKTGGRATRERSRFLDGIVPDLAQSSAAHVGRRPKRCRVCGLRLDSPKEKTLGRHLDCDGGLDEEIFGALRQWRAALAKANDMPAYLIFSDATLSAIAETRPRTHAQLLSVSGVGQSKLDNYGDEVLAVLARFESES